MMNKFDSVILASASPRRKELLGQIFTDFEVEVSKVEEKLKEGISIYKQPEHLAFIKGEAVSCKHFESLVISADTCVFLNEKILGKPRDKADAIEMLKLLSGKTHKVITGCAIFYKGKAKTFSVTSEVKFYELTDSEIFEYVESGDCMDKAGSYGIQSKGSLFVKEIHGDYFNIVGLPIAELNRQINNL